MLPSKYERNSAPSSVIFRSPACPKLKIWNPPESVKIALSQFINLWSPPASLINSWPGLKNKWYVFPNIISAFTSSFNSSGVIAFTVACVPTGINTGVCISPCGVWITPLLAPEFLSICKSS